MERSGAWDFAAEFKIDLFGIRILTTDGGGGDGGGGVGGGDGGSGGSGGGDGGGGDGDGGGGDGDGGSFASWRPCTGSSSSRSSRIAAVDGGGADGAGRASRAKNCACGAAVSLTLAGNCAALPKSAREAMASR